MHAFDLTRLWGLYWEPSWTFAEVTDALSPILKGAPFFIKHPYFCSGITSVKIYLESQICLRSFLTIGETCLFHKASQQAHPHIHLTWSTLFQMNSSYLGIKFYLYFITICSLLITGYKTSLTVYGEVILRYPFSTEI